MYERTNPANTKVSKAEGGDTLSVRGEVPLQPMVKATMKQAVPLHLISGIDIHLQPVQDPMPEQLDAERKL